MDENILIDLFCKIDDFCNEFEKKWSQYLLDSRKRIRKSQLAMSEVMTILVFFHFSNRTTFKHYFEKDFDFLKRYFPQLVSYNRFTELIRTAIIPLFIYLQLFEVQKSGIYFIDSTKLAVCHNKRISRHRVFQNIAKRGKTTMGWFFGFKLHLVINEIGEIVAFRLTPGNCDDRNPVSELTNNLMGSLVGDKGYISHKLFQELYDRGLHLITQLKSNMKNKLMPLWDKFILSKRALIESVNNQLKNVFHIEHTRHRNSWNAMAYWLSCLVGYMHYPNKAKLNLDSDLKQIIQHIA
jgi:hypothetical protein